MNTNIDHGDRVDLEDLATLAREQAEILDANIPKDDESYDEWLDDCIDAKETLADLSALLSELGYHPDEEDGEAIADDFDHVANNGDSQLIAEDYFVTAMQELVTDIGDLPQEIPSYLEIDWEATAENLKADYSEVELDGETYYHRSF